MILNVFIKYSFPLNWFGNALFLGIRSPDIMLSILEFLKQNMSETELKAMIVNKDKKYGFSNKFCPFENYGIMENWSLLHAALLWGDDKSVRIIDFLLDKGWDDFLCDLIYQEPDYIVMQSAVENSRIEAIKQMLNCVLKCKSRSGVMNIVDRLKSLSILDASACSVSEHVLVLKIEIRSPICSLSEAFHTTFDIINFNF
jgi:hypothetical protein